MILNPCAAISRAAMPPDVAKALDHHARVSPGVRSKSLQRFKRHDHAAAAGRFGPSARSAQIQRLAGDHRGNRVARVHGVGVHDPRHHLLVGVHVGRGHVASPVR